MMMNNHNPEPEEKAKPGVELPPLAIAAGTKIHDVILKFMRTKFGVEPGGTDQDVRNIVTGLAALVNHETQYSCLLDLLCMIRDGLKVGEIKSNPVKGVLEGEDAVFVVRSLEGLITEVLAEHGR